MELVRLSVEDFSSSIDASYFRVFEEFVKKVIQDNPSCDTHRHFNDTTFMSAGELSVPTRTKVLKLDGYRGLESVDFKGLRRLRSLFIESCPVLKEVIGWESLRELAWLEIADYPSFDGYPQNLPSLKEFRFRRFDASERPPISDLGMSQCVRLRTLEIYKDEALEETGDLSSLKCLEVLIFSGCSALNWLPDLSHMKELVHLDVSGTGLEEIQGVEKLVSLKILDCKDSKLKLLPGLRHLLALQKVWLEGTPLVDDPLSFYFKGNLDAV